MRRIMTPRADGSLLVPPEIWKQWKDLREGGREAVTKLWNQSGKDKDNFLRRCKKKVESIQEKDLWVEGAFMSEQDMKDEKFPEKRKRQVLEEEESMDEDEFDKLKKEEDQDLLPSKLSLPEDTTDATIVIEADGMECQKNSLKALNFPVMDDEDALASSYIPRVLACLSKWSVKLQDLVEIFAAMESVPENMTMLYQRASEIDKNFQTITDDITKLNTQGIVDGYKRTHQDQLAKEFVRARKECAEALSLVTRAQLGT
ncbi:unnamed protein product [Durusdinium trenchii]|uniref:Uncharacterized protein n=1 Tax=Durusdinium trenchii TaxID=1381693 RepID=A0ABP0NHQ7_9DINO